MQYGTFITIPVLAVIALALRRVRLAVAFLLSGVGVYVLAIVIKGIVQRERPAGLLEGVEGREVFAEGSLGFPSGHAAVAAALTVVVAAHLSRRWMLAAVAFGVACSSAVYTSAPTFLWASWEAPHLGQWPEASSTY